MKCVCDIIRMSYPSLDLKYRTVYDYSGVVGIWVERCLETKWGSSLTLYVWLASEPPEVPACLKKSLKRTQLSWILLAGYYSLIRHRYFCFFFCKSFSWKYPLNNPLHQNLSDFIGRKEVHYHTPLPTFVFYTAIFERQLSPDWFSSPTLSDLSFVRVTGDAPLLVLEQRMRYYLFDTNAEWLSCNFSSK